MPIEHNGQTLYNPRETAKKLGISVGMLRYLRNEGRIEGTKLETTTLYSDEQIANADLTPRSRGRRGVSTSESEQDNEGSEHHFAIAL